MEQATKRTGPSPIRPLQNLDRSERIDFHLSRAMPKLAGRLHALALRVSGGRLGARKRDVPVGVLSVAGRRSGKVRRVPLMYMRDGDDFLVVAANAGHDEPPAWFLNVRDASSAGFAVEGEERRVEARVLAPAEREQQWPRLREHNPLWQAFDDCTAREVAVVRLAPIPAGPAT